MLYCTSSSECYQNFLIPNFFSFTVGVATTFGFVWWTSPVFRAAPYPVKQLTYDGFAPRVNHRDANPRVDSPLTPSSVLLLRVIPRLVEELESNWQI